MNRCQECGERTFGTLLCCDCEMDLSRGFEVGKRFRNARVNAFCVGLITGSLGLLVAELML